MRYATPLFTDMYQLTMANALFHAGIADREATFNLYYRRPPVGSSYVIFAGIQQALEWLAALSTDERDMSFIRRNVGNLHPNFVSALRDIHAAVAKLRIRSFDEGSVVYPNTPMVTVTGPQWIAQLIETPFLNEVNHQSLIATTTGPICDAAASDPVFEMGFRRAQGASAAVNGARAAYIGGVAGTSNMLAGSMYSIPVIGTHAHSWIMSFPSERDAFIAYATVYGNDSVFLVDTYDTFEGTKMAIEVSKELGVYPKGIRLDSGDLWLLSRACRKILDGAGFHDTVIVASNNLDAHMITDLKAGEAPIGAWGVGTRLITAFAEPALGGVYKLASYVQDRRRVNVAKNTPGKTSLPGQLNVVRCFVGDGMLPVNDIIYSADIAMPVCDGVQCVSMLHDVFVEGRAMPRVFYSIDSMRDRAADKRRLHKNVSFNVVVHNSVGI